MSGWIKMGISLASHPKVKALRRALKADRLKVIGGLWAVWCVFDEHSASGRLDGYTLDDMDEEIGWRGFSEAMRDIGWLLSDDDGLEAPDYEEHNGPNAKRRALDASRKGRSRASKADDEPPPDPQAKRTQVRTSSGTVSASDADNMRNREEKRREELSEAKASDAGASPPTPKDRVFAFGVPLLTAAGVADKNARSMLAGLCKRHGDEAVADAIDRCASEQAIEPVSWLQAALKPSPGRPGPSTPRRGAAERPPDIFEAGAV